MISPIKNPGGAYYKLKYILPAIQWKSIYCESCAGGLNVLLNSPRETQKGTPITKYAFDTNKLLINCWKFIQQDPIGLQKFLRNIDYSEENFRAAGKYIQDHEDSIDEDCQWFMLAAMYLVRNRFSRAADEKTFGWSDRLRRGKPEYISAWETCVDSIPAVSDCIKGVVFEAGDCMELIIKHRLNEKEDCTFFFDPPFVKDTRVSKKMYGRYEMPTLCEDTNGGIHISSHECILDFILYGIFGTTYVLGYDNELYKKKLGSPYISFSSKCSASQTKKKPVRIDCLWKVS